MKIKSVQTAIKRISILISLLVLSQACNPSGDAKKKDNTLLYGALAVSAAQANAPVITSFTPLYGGVGTTVTVKGKNLTSVTKVTLSETRTSSVTADVITATADTLTFKVPSTVNSGSFIIKIGNSSSTSWFEIVSVFYYTKESISATQNSTSVSNTVSGTLSFLNTSASSYTSSPSLPAGLSLNSSTGALSGTATGTTSNAYVTYTISAILNNESSVKATSSFKLLVATAAETTNRTCNTSGIASGCTAGSPYSCTNTGTCYGGTSGYTNCVADTSCGF